MIKRNIVLQVCFIIVALTLFISTAGAKNVSQVIGFKDVGFSSLNKQFCKGCHGDSLVETHHETGKFEAGSCTFCHSVSQHNDNFGVVLLRDCMKCHKETPHHKTEAALDNECTSCHDTAGLSDYSTDVVDYGITKVTPAVSNCGRCHGDGKVDDLNIVGYEDTHHDIGLENCNTCHTDTDPKTVNIRICERCHNVKAIHSVAHHVVPENCVVCHISEK
jgi:hypothetical protein